MYNPTQSLNAFAMGQNIGSGMRNRETQNAFSQYMKNDDLQGAQKYALDRGNMQLAEYASGQMASHAEAQKTADTERTRRAYEGVKLIAQQTDFQSRMQMAQHLSQELGIPAPDDPNDLTDGELQKQLETLRIQGNFTEDQQDPYTLAPGAVRFGANNQVVASNPKVVERKIATDALGRRRYVDTGEVVPGFDETKPVREQPSLNLQFGEDGGLMGLGYGTAPKGKEAAIVRGSEGEALVTSGPQQQLYNKSYKALQDYQVTNDLVLEDIDRAIESAGTWTTGLAGSVLENVPGTSAFDLSKALDSVKANIGFDKLQEMRDNSPTGGALGQVSEWELQLLQSVLGSLEQAQTKEQFTYNLNRIKEIKQEGARRRAEAFKQDFPTLSQQASFMNETQSSIDDLVAKYAGGS